MKLIQRNDYLNKLIQAKNTPDIKVITGIRRCGKSKLLESFIAYLLNNDSEANIISINFNLPEFDSLLDSKRLYSYINERFLEGKNNYVFIDEVQMCQNFEKTINGLHAQEKYDIYLTGSNAFLLSSDLATLFTGRTIEIKVYPFSFKEYMEYYNTETDIQKLFNRYVKDGGMSGSYVYSSEEMRYEYINQVFNTLIIRDINQKYKIRNQILMNKLVEYLLDNISNLTSSRNVANYLMSHDDKTNHKTIGSYINYLCLAFAFYKIKRYDVKGKKYLSTTDKYYVCDQSFRYAKIGNKNYDYGRILENIIALELLRRGYEVYVGVLYKKEIDFVAIKRNEKIYIQVSDDISNKDTFNREVTPLLQINDAYPKIIISNTKQDEYQFEGVKIIDITNWLLS